MFRFRVVTLALGLQPRQGLAKGASQE